MFRIEIQQSFSNFYIRIFQLNGRSLKYSLVEHNQWFLRKELKNMKKWNEASIFCSVHIKLSLAVYSSLMNGKRLVRVWILNKNAKIVQLQGIYNSESNCIDLKLIHRTGYTNWVVIPLLTMFNILTSLILN